MNLRQPPVANSPKHEPNREPVDSVLKAEVTRTAKGYDPRDRSPGRQNNRAAHPYRSASRAHGLPMLVQGLRRQKPSAKKRS